MDIEKLLKIATTYMSDYVKQFIETLSRPRCAVGTSGGQAITGSSDFPKDNAETILDTKVWLFVFLSVFIGSTLALTSGIQKKNDLQGLMIYVITNWVAFSFYAFLICRFILRGSANFLTTLNTTLYVLSVIYVVCNFAALLGSFVPPVTIKGTPFHLASNLLYVGLQGLLLAFYLTWNLLKLNSFSKVKAVVLIILLPIPVVLINGLVSFGVFFYPEIVNMMDFHK